MKKRAFDITKILLLCAPFSRNWSQLKQVAQTHVTRKESKELYTSDSVSVALQATIQNKRVYTKNMILRSTNA